MVLKRSSSLTLLWEFFPVTLFALISSLYCFCFLLVPLLALALTALLHAAYPADLSSVLCVPLFPMLAFLHFPEVHLGVDGTASDSIPSTSICTTPVLALCT